VIYTEDGDEIILKNTGTWNYLDEKADRDSVIRVNGKIESALSHYIERRDPVFFTTFRMKIDWGMPYDKKCDAIMLNFYYLYTQNPVEKYFDVLMKVFGNRTAERFIWLFDNWELWVKYCKKTAD
jgi:hypothetical protein